MFENGLDIKIIDKSKKATPKEQKKKHEINIEDKDVYKMDRSNPIETRLNTPVKTTIKKVI